MQTHLPTQIRDHSASAGKCKSLKGDKNTLSFKNIYKLLRNLVLCLLIGGLVIHSSGVFFFGVLIFQ